MSVGLHKYLLPFLLLPITVKAASQPNIIVILSDDMGISDIGCYGGEIDTPSLDGLAANGLRFTQFYNTGRCCPTRASLLSGLYPHQAGVGHMMGDRGVDGYRGEFSKKAVTIAEALKPAGYSTYMVGKWHLTKHVKGKTEADRQNWPRQRGFDRFYGTIHGAGSFWDPNSLTRDNTLITPENDLEYQPDNGFYYTDAISDNAVKYIEENDSNKPFFLYVAYTAAHWPLHAREEDMAKYRGKYDGGYDSIRQARFRRMQEIGLIGTESKLSPTVGNWESVENKDVALRNMETYAAMVTSMDEGIGRIVQQLKDQNILDDTLILFMQDNGGCQEDFLVRRRNDGRRASTPAEEAMSQDELQTAMVPKKSRAGFPMRLGPRVMPGPADTYNMVGLNWANVSNTPFRRYKHFVHEGGSSTPLIVHWPAAVSAKGEWRRTPGHVIDIMATCIDVSGAEFPKAHNGNEIQPMEGKSLVPVFKGQTIDRDALYWEHERNCAIRVGKWKLVGAGVLTDSGPDINKWELYDMERDRSELNDLAESNPEIRQRLHDQYMEYCKRASVLPTLSKERQQKRKERIKNRKKL
ncbi:MAG: arylsulfatase [Kiritimatiellia bacterium]|jgi:arylsulfatase|nr:arylsulfatase [Kiritimatiellia bacterium]